MFKQTQQLALQVFQEEREVRIEALLDEAIIVALVALRIALEEVSEEGEQLSAMDFLEGVYEEKEGTVWELIMNRFRDTKKLHDKYLSGNAEERNKLRPQLLARGIL